MRFLACGAVALLLGSASAADKPNVLIVIADDLGYSDLGCYGSEIATPNLDALAAAGLRFTRFHNTARCWPSRASVLSGYYPQQVRRDLVPGIVSGAGGTRPAWAKLLPDLLKPGGYRSYHSGKWHVDGKPTAQGFDRSYTLHDGGRYFGPKNHLLDEKPLPQPPADAGYYSTVAIADHAVQCLADHAQAHAGRPFFQYVAFTAPHFPLHALPQDIAKYKDVYKVGWEAVRAKRHARLKELGLVTCELSPVERDLGPPYRHPDAYRTLGDGESEKPVAWTELTDVQKEFQAAKMAIHAAMIDRMDQEIGRILAQLKKMGAMENTLIFFVSDNGASAEIMVRDDGHDPKAAPGSAGTHLCLGPGWSSAANTPLRRHKTWVHEGGTSTPLIVHWPKGIAAKGELRHTPGHLIDIVPTVLSLADLPVPDQLAKPAGPDLPGRNLAPVFAKDGGPDRELWWLHEGNRALQNGNWKIVAARDAEWELYDLSTDRAESRNLAADQPQRVADMVARWTALRDSYFATAKIGATPSPMGKATKKKAK